MKVKMCLVSPQFNNRLDWDVSYYQGSKEFIIEEKICGTKLFVDMDEMYLLFQNLKPLMDAYREYKSQCEMVNCES